MRRCAPVGSLRSPHAVPTSSSPAATTSTAAFISGHPLPERPLDDCDPEQDRADTDDRRVSTRSPADDGQRQEEREDRQAEARDREQWPAAAGDAERNRQAERREQPVGRAEAPPGDHRQRDEESEEGKILEV